ncbi:hypothetical protein FSP39_018978 [Pinctada imbricata]|uniref:Large ribosomal subunit protein uL11 n=1 Tax=Pinctada imbricata TaxID=66713 RepID=A0AA88YKM1_PINIB|nr:hypothetical protein FSP39_018978 [Pinctada imbricata]
MRCRPSHCRNTACVAASMTIAWVTVTTFIQIHQTIVKHRQDIDDGNSIRGLWQGQLFDYPDILFASNETEENVTEVLPWLQMGKPTHESIVVPPLLVDGVEKYVGYAKNQSLKYGNHVTDRVYLSIGIPTVSRAWGNENYLFKTLESLIANSSPEDLTRMVFVVFMADFNNTWNEVSAKNLRKRYFDLCENGTIQIVTVPYGIYPDFSQLNGTLGDTKERTIWRSKQNIDFAFMMLYSRKLSYYYMQLEDDVISANNYLRGIRKFIDLQKNKFWACLEVSKLGFIGKIFKTSHLPKFSSFFLAFYETFPCDVLLGRVYSLLGQKKPLHSPESLFQHIGKVSSLKHKIMPSIDQNFKFIGQSKLAVAEVPKGDNPPAIIRTNMKAMENNRLPEHAYSNSSSYFKVRTPRKDSFYTILFRKPQRVQRIVVSTGDDTTKKDILNYGDVYIGEFQTRTPACKNTRKAGPFVDGFFDSFLQGFKLPKFLIFYVKSVGGEVPATSSLAPKIGPLGLSPKKVGDDISKATVDWKGLKITCKLVVQNRQAKVEVVPSASSLVIKALKEPPRDRKKVKHVKHTGNISFDEILNIARQMRPRSMARKLEGTVKEILGTAQSVGCSVDRTPPHDIIDKINNGEYEVPDVSHTCMQDCKD